MSNPCKYCGAKLEQTHSICPSCNRAVDSASDASANKPLDEIKKNFIDMSGKAISMAKGIGADLASETKKINEARKQAAESDEIKGAQNKSAAIKTGVQIFWQKLTVKQKAITVGIPLFLFVCMMAIFEGGNADIASCAKPTKSGQQERCAKLLENGSQPLVGSKLYGSEIWGLNYRKDSGFDVVEFQLSSSTTRKQALSTMNRLCQDNLVVMQDTADAFSAMTKSRKAGEPLCSINMVLKSPRNERYATNSIQWGVFNASTTNWR